MVVTRTNTVNGLRYSEDPTILAWEVMGLQTHFVCVCTYNISLLSARLIPSVQLSNHLPPQTGNELNAPTEWTRAVAAFIKVGKR